MVCVHYGFFSLLLKKFGKNAQNRYSYSAKETYRGEIWFRKDNRTVPNKDRTEGKFGQKK